VEELCLLRHVRVVVALGRIAFDQYLKACIAVGHKLPRPKPSFGHGKAYELPWNVTLISSYHPSQQNTFTKRLTKRMFYGVFKRSRRALTA
jgi:uracil-DNA glycosylase